MLVRRSGVCGWRMGLENEIGEMMRSREKGQSRLLVDLGIG